MKNIYIGCIGLAIMISACTPTEVKNIRDKSVFEHMVDHDIREVINYYGLVDYAYDLNDGRRVFLWQERSLYGTPHQTVKQRRERGYNYSPWFRPENELTHQNPYEHLCTYEFTTRYYHDRNAWMVEEFAGPRRKCIPGDIHPL